MGHKITVEEHPWPAVLIHWTHLVSFLVLIVTGLLIHMAPAGVDMQLVRTLHFFMMFVFLLTTIVRIYYAIFGRGTAKAGKTTLEPDWTNFWPEKANKGQFFETIKYYLFIRKTHPNCPKYNPLQKMTYGFLFPAGTFFMALTGFALWTNTLQYFTWFTNAVGGLGNVRVMHYFGMWALVIFWMIHVYLVVFEEPEQMLTMMFHYAPGESDAKTADAKAAAKS